MTLPHGASKAGVHMAKVEKCIFEYFASYASQCADDLFLFDEDRHYSVAETFREAIAIGNQLHDLGVKEGSMVALRCTRSVDAYLIYLAIEFLGATAVLTDPHQNVDVFLQETGLPIQADFVITNELADQGISANHDWQIVGYGPLEIGYPARCEERRFNVRTDLRAPATIIFTSGSTGTSKGSMLCQESLLQYAEDSIVHDWHHPGDIAIVTLPTQHGFALCLLIAAFVARYALFFPRDMSVDYVLDCIERYHITRINGVPSYLYALARANEANPRDLRTLRTGFTAGAPVIPEHHRYIEQVLGMQVHPLYGMSESISISCTAPSDPAECRATTVGRFHRNAGCILDINGQALPVGQEGEVCVSGPAILLGYYGDDAATRQAIDENGWLHTGDLGYVDDGGYLHITGRIKNIIIRNGINLSPAKIETAIRTIPGVENAVVVGIQHELLGEVPCALVDLRSGCEANAEALKAVLCSKLAKNEIPDSIIFAAEIPLNNIGKPDKKKITELLSSGGKYESN